VCWLAWQIPPQNHEKCPCRLPQAWTEYRDRGLAHAEARHPGHALEDLETYLANAGAASDRTAITERAAELRRATH